MPGYKKLEDREQPEEVFHASRVVTGPELGIGIGLLVFAAIFPSAVILWWGRPGALSDFVTLVILWIYMFAVISTFAIILLWGLGRLDLPAGFMKWLGGATVGEIAGLLLFALKHVF